jgi:myosin heavy subunit
MFQRKSLLKILVSCFVSCLFLAGSLPVGAQKVEMGQGKKQGHAGQQVMQQKIQRMQEIGKKLQSVQEKTLKENPELQNERDELDSLVQGTMDQNMEKHNVSKKELKSLQSKMQGKDMASGQKKELRNQWQEKISSYRQARTETMSNEQIQEKQETFRENMIEAMEEKEPKTKEMLKELEGLQQEMQAMQQQMMQQQKRGQGQGGKGATKE